MGLIILGSVAVVILAILLFPVKLYVEYTDGKPKILLRYLFFRKNLSDRKAKKTEKKTSSGKKTQEKSDKEKKGGLIPSDTKGRIEFFKSVLKAGGKALKRFTKRIKIKDVMIDFVISDEDAYECAIKFGKTNIIVYNALSYLGSFVRIKKKSINIRCVYNMPQSVYNMKFCVCITPLGALGIIIAFIASFAAIIIKSKFNSEKSEKHSEKKAA